MDAAGLVFTLLLLLLLLTNDMEWTIEMIASD